MNLITNILTTGHHHRQDHKKRPTGSGKRPICERPLLHLTVVHQRFVRNNFQILPCLLCPHTYNMRILIMAYMSFSQYEHKNCQLHSISTLTHLMFAYLGKAGVRRDGQTAVTTQAIRIRDVMVRALAIFLFPPLHSRS